ncbi:hypothetical protein D3C75_1150810 [compost metagenome]
MNLLKAKTKIECNTCGCTLNRSKTIAVEAVTKEEAIKEANVKIASWKLSLVGKNCAVCASIIKSLQ